jgi:hypothetical protein
MAKQDISLFLKGENWPMDLTLQDAAGAALNLTGATIVFRLNNVALGTVTLTNAALGLAKINVTPAQQTAAGIIEGSYKYEIRATLSDGTVTTQLWGAFEVLPTLFP